MRTVTGICRCIWLSCRYMYLRGDTATIIPSTAMQLKLFNRKTSFLTSQASKRCSIQNMKVDCNTKLLLFWGTFITQMVTRLASKSVIQRIAKSDCHILVMTQLSDTRDVISPRLRVPIYCLQWSMELSIFRNMIILDLPTPYLEHSMLAIIAFRGPN